MVDSYIEKMGTATAMQRYGGSFVKRLGSALILADPTNEAKIKDAFPEYFEKYRRIAEQHDYFGDE